jgi:hypothetical protein
MKANKLKKLSKRVGTVMDFNKVPAASPLLEIFSETDPTNTTVTIVTTVNTYLNVRK